MNLIKNCKNILKNILTSGSTIEDPESFNKLIMLNSTFIMAICFYTFFILFFFADNHLTDAFSLFVVQLITILTMVYLRKTKDYDNSALAFVFSVVLFNILQTSIGTYGNLDSLWVFLTPLSSYFFLGLYRGSIMSLSALVIFLLLMNLPYMPEIFTEAYSFDFKIRFFIVYIIIMLMSFIYEYLRDRSLRKLKFSENRFQNVALSSGDFIWEIDKNSKYTSATGNVMKLLGYSPEELIGKTPFDLMPEKEAKKVSEIFAKIAAEKKPIVDLENWNIKKNGEKVCLLTNGIPVLNEKGELEGYCGVDKDITARKKSQENLIKERQKAELYLDILSHDMGNINQGIISYLELTLLRNNDFDEKSEKFILRALEQAKDMSVLSTNVRKLAKIEDEKLIIVPVDINKVLMKSIDRVKNNNPNKNIDISFNITKKDVLVSGNELLEDVFVNLLGNATKYHNNNIIKIEIIVNEIKDKNFVKIEFKDFGQGISDEFKKVIFKRLQRGDESVHGTGLGLAIVENVVTQLGGKVKVEDRVKGHYKRGANFIVLLPRMEKIHYKH